MGNSDHVQGFGEFQNFGEGYLSPENYQFNRNLMLFSLFLSFVRVLHSLGLPNRWSNHVKS